MTGVQTCALPISHLAAPAKEPLMTLTITYTVSANGGIRITTAAKKRAGAPELPRFGYRITMPEGAEDIRYFGYGPYESYEDKRLASRIDLFRTTATENYEPYIRPQENSAHYGCRFADVSLPYGQGLYFSAEKFSLSASHYTPEALTEAKHEYELTPDKNTTVIIDYRNAGIGSNSCGPKLIAKYAISEEQINFTFTIKPHFSGNISPFSEYAK